jgi:DnaJ family protein A protein 2
MDHYATLGITRYADNVQIKKAYHSLALQHHPDKGGDVEKFKCINEAYETLSDPNKRSIYDNVPILSMSKRRKSPLYTKTIKVDLIDLYNGLNSIVFLDENFQCDICLGVGTTIQNPPKCVQCSGSGFVVMTHHLAFLVHKTQIPCTKCNGKGISIPPEDFCITCAGDGIIKSSKQFHIMIPAGTLPDETIIMPNVGPCLPGCVPCDIAIIIKQKDHPMFVRDGIHLTTTLKVPLATALAGGPFLVNLLGHSKKGFVCKPGEITPGTRRCLPGYGFPVKGTKQFGNLYIVFEVEWPTVLSDETILALKKEQPIIPGSVDFSRLSSLERC